MSPYHPITSPPGNTDTYCGAAGDARRCRSLLEGVCRSLEGKRERPKAGKAVHAHSMTCQTLYGGLAELTARLTQKGGGGGGGLERQPYSWEMLCSRLCSVLVIACKSLGVKAVCNQIKTNWWRRVFFGSSLCKTQREDSISTVVFKSNTAYLMYSCKTPDFLPHSPLMDR